MKLSQSETDCEDSKSYLKSNLTEEEKRELKKCINSKIDTVIINGNYIIILIENHYIIIGKPNIILDLFL